MKMHIKTLACVAGLSLLPVIAYSSEKLPKFPKKTAYVEARKSLIGLGWEPVKLPDSDECSDGDARCRDRPEMHICAGTGEANCIFTWKRKDTLVEIHTIQEEPIVTAVRCRAGCR